MNLKNFGLELCKKYVFPIITTIVKSAISKIGKSLYEKLYDKFQKALESFGEAVEKMFNTDNPEKLKKRIECCSLGLGFFEKIHQVLEEIIPEYSAAIAEAKERLEKITSGEIGGE